MDEFWIQTSVVVLLAMVQSLFGVGLLVFGTPTLLLLGYSFESAIAVLLPASITISFMQVLAGRNHIEHLKKEILVFGVPFIVLGLVLVLTNMLVLDMKLLVGIMLVSTAFLRYHKNAQRGLSNLLKKHGRLFIMAMGMVHGLSNMGGGLLTVLVSATYQEKDSIRANIAYGYLIFAAAQLTVLAFLNPSAFSINSVILSLISLLTYGTVGHVLYLRSSRAVYQQLITLFMLAYGVILIWQRFI